MEWQFSKGQSGVEPSCLHGGDLSGEKERGGNVLCEVIMSIPQPP